MIDIHAAAQAGDVAGIKTCIEQMGLGVVNYTDWGGSNPIHLAVKNRHREATLYLLSQGATVDISGDDGVPTIFEIIKWGDREVWEATLAQKPDLAFINDNGESVIFTLLNEGKTDWAMEALESGCEIHLSNGNSLGETPLHICARDNLQEIADMIIEKGGMLTKVTYHTEESILHYALKAQNLEFAKNIWEKKASLLLVANHEGQLPSDFLEGMLPAKEIKKLVFQAEQEELEEIRKAMAEYFEKNPESGEIFIEQSTKIYSGKIVSGTLSVSSKPNTKKAIVDVNSYISRIRADG
jgi:ankyrin repeat protein